MTSAHAINAAMNYLGKPRIAFYPGEGDNTPAEPEIPVQTSEPEPLVVATDEPEAPAEEPTGEPAADSDTPPADGKKPPKLPDWAQKQMAQQAFEAREANRKLKAAEEELSKLKGTAAAPEVAPNAADAAAARENAPAGGYKSEADFNAAVEAETGRRAQAEMQAKARADFDAACNTAYQKGKGAYNEDFDAAVQNLQQVGFMSPDMLQFVLEADDPSKVLYDLGSDPDRAATIMGLPPAKRAIEIAKMAVAPTKAAPANPLSRAPRPVDTVDGSARPSVDPTDGDDDATWFAKRNEQIRRRYANG